MLQWLQQLKQSNQLLAERYLFQQELGEGTFGVTSTVIDTHKPSQPIACIH